MSFWKKLSFAIQNPELAWQIGRMLGKNKLIKWGTPMLNGKAPPPSLITLEPSNRCNLACQICGRWEMGKNAHIPREMTLEVYDRLLEELKAFNPFISISGGEPTLYPHIVEIVRRIKQKGFHASMVTNGLLLMDLARHFVEAGLDVLHVSLDGIPAVHDTIRRRAGAFEQTAEGIGEVARLKAGLGKLKPFMQIIHVITEKSYETLPLFLEECSRLPIQSVRLQHLWFATPQMLRSHNLKVPEALKIWRSEASIKRAIQDIDRRRIDPEKLFDVLCEVKQKAYPFSLSIFPDLALDQIKTYYQRPCEAVESRCIDSYVHAVITSNGDVSPCMDFVAGNIQEKPFLEIWNGPAYAHFRQSLKEAGGHFPYCTRCCGIFSHKSLP